MSTSHSYLINVGMPHFCEKAESRRRVWVVNGELDSSLKGKNTFASEKQAVYLHFSFANGQVSTTSIQTIAI